MGNFLKNILQKARLKKSPYQKSILKGYKKELKKIISERHVEYADEIITNKNSFEVILTENTNNNKQLKQQLMVLNEEVNKNKKNCSELEIEKINLQRSTIQKQTDENKLKITIADKELTKSNNEAKMKYSKWLKNQKKLNKEAKKLEKKKLILQWKSKDIEEKNIVRDKYQEELVNLSFYRPNVIGFWFILICVVLECFYIVKLLAVMERSYLVGVVILFNIAVLLLLFTCALQVKVYKKLFSYIIGIYGVYSLLRLLVLPYILKITDNLVLFACLNIIMGITCVYVGVSSIYKINKKEKFKADGKISLKQMSK